MILSTVLYMCDTTMTFQLFEYKQFEMLIYPLSTSTMKDLIYQERFSEWYEKFWFA